MVDIKNINLEKVKLESSNKPHYSLNGQSFSTENAAARYFENLGYSIINGENLFWWHIAALIFWDIIFAKVEGAVAIIENGEPFPIHPQHERYDVLFDKFISINGMPADFFTDQFYYRRKNLFENKIKQLENSDIVSIVTDSYKKHYDKTCRMVADWAQYSLEQLLIPIQLLQKKPLLEMLQRVMQDVSNKRKGLPDLCIYKDNEFCFCEVKSENDTIKEHQKEWHEFLSDSLGFNVIVLLINHKETKIEKIKNKYKPKGNLIKFVISKNSAENRKELIDFLEEQSIFSEVNNEFTIKIKLHETNIENIFRLFELSSGIKQRYFEFKDEKITPAVLKKGLTCCLDRIQQKAASNYCDGILDSNRRNPFGCKKFKFSELHYNYWDKYGYVDTNTGEWIFDKNSIHHEISKQIAKYKFCPFFDENKILKLANKLPDKVHPKKDLNWAYITNESETWFWHEDMWLTSEYGKKEPDYSLLVGIQWISKSDKNKAKREYLQSQKDEQFISDFETNPSKLFQDEIPKKKEGCFIATAVYGSYDNPNVLVLRKFRDDILSESKFGRIFISRYYKYSPRIAKKCKDNILFQSISRLMLHIFIMGIKKKIDKIQKQNGAE